jgi:hypothetical protein
MQLHLFPSNPRQPIKLKLEANLTQKQFKREHGIAYRKERLDSFELCFIIQLTATE